MSAYFFTQMNELLGSEYPEFEAAYNEKPRYKALRVNTLKITPDEFAATAKRLETSGVREYALRRNALCAQSFYTSVKPSLDPLYHAGLYYMQEPSASAAVAAFAPYIGTRILDLCAAPGGKSTQAAAFMSGGTIFCNDTDRSRARVLHENLSRLGVANAVVTNSTAAQYRAAGFDGYFDTVMVDAPCSGGGMMRYENVPYSAEIVAGCAKRQREILKDAAELVARGGYMLYSTCTFSREENEGNIHYLESLGFVTVDLPLKCGERRGIDCPNARRVYPHAFDGEGHFYCVLKKPDGNIGAVDNMRAAHAEARVGGLKIDCAKLNGVTVLPIDAPDLRGLNVIACGTAVFDGEFCRRRGKNVKTREAEISHELTHALSREQLKTANAIELDYSDAEKYIHGEQLDLRTDCGHGLRIVTIDGFALGRARAASNGAGENVLKNLYPTSLRV